MLECTKVRTEYTRFVYLHIVIDRYNRAIVIHRKKMGKREGVCLVWNRPTLHELFKFIFNVYNVHVISASCNIIPLLLFQVRSSVIIPSLIESLTQFCCYLIKSWFCSAVCFCHTVFVVGLDAPVSVNLPMQPPLCCDPLPITDTMWSAQSLLFNIF